MGVTRRLLSTVEPDWSIGRIEDAINERRLPWSGYVQGQGNVTGATIKPNADWTVAKVDRDGSKMTLIWTTGEAVIVEAVRVPLSSPGTRTASKRRAPLGRPPDYPIAIIRQITRDYIKVYGLPRTQAMLREKVADECERNGFRVPGETRLGQLVNPIHKAQSRAKNHKVTN
jgi:hypothetical protein